MKKLIYSSLGVALLTTAALAQVNYAPELAPACIQFVNGSGHFGEHCYSSGLMNMAPNACYALNPARIADGTGSYPYINNNAADTWWWKRTTCRMDTVYVALPGTYTLEPRCIQFVNGAGQYTVNCYNSGLMNMAANTCYALNPARIADGTGYYQYINNNAADTWWWVPAACNDTLPIYPPSSCYSNPTSMSCLDFCSEHLNNEFCQNNLCVMFPTNPSCVSAPSVCSDITDPACAMACLANPNADPRCPEAICSNDPTNVSNCRTACSMNPSGVACHSFCAVSPGDWFCRSLPPIPTQEACLVDPNSQSCQNFCEANPADGACDPNYCVNNPNDLNCVDKCINFVNGAGYYTESCYKSGLQNMRPNTCYAVNPVRVSEGVVPVTGHMNNNAADVWWWLQTPCEKVYRIPGSVSPHYEGRPEPKSAQMDTPTLGESEISVDNTTLNVTSTEAGSKVLRVFDMNGKLLHSETFSGLVKDIDFAKFAGKGVLLVRVTSGNKLVAMKKISIR